MSERPLIAFQFDNDRLVFERVCPNCRRFVKADGWLMWIFTRPGTEPTWIVVNKFTDILRNQSNADCKCCGRVTMPFLGFFERSEVGLRPQNDGR